MMALLTVNCLVNCIKLDHAKLTNKQTLTTRLTGLVLSYMFGVHNYRLSQKVMDGQISPDKTVK